MARQPPARMQNRPAPAKQVPLKDLHIFARLPPDSRLRNEKAYDLYAFLREKLPAPAREALKGINHIRTGLTLLPSSPKGAKVLLDHKSQITTLLKAHIIEQRDIWARAYIANVPCTRHCLITNTKLDITGEELLKKIQHATKLKPEKAFFSKKDEMEKLGTISAWFKVEAVRHLPRHLRLMGADVFVNLQFPKGRKSAQCHRCGGFHNERTCTRRKRCLKCSSTTYFTDAYRAPCGGTEGHNGYDCPLKCPSCNGPHAAFDATCPIRPKVVNGTIQRRDKAQLRAIRAEGARLWRMASQLSHIQTQRGESAMDGIIANELQQ